MINCRYCNYTVDTIDHDQASYEFDKHMMECHPVELVPGPLALNMLELHLKYQTPINELVAKFTEIRKALAPLEAVGGEYND